MRTAGRSQATSPSLLVRTKMGSVGTFSAEQRKSHSVCLATRPLRVSPSGWELTRKNGSDLTGNNMRLTQVLMKKKRGCVVLISKGPTSKRTADPDSTSSQRLRALPRSDTTQTQASDALELRTDGKPATPTSQRYNFFPESARSFRSRLLRRWRAEGGGTSADS